LPLLVSSASLPPFTSISRDVPWAWDRCGMMVDAPAHAHRLPPASGKRCRIFLLALFSFEPLLIPAGALVGPRCGGRFLLFSLPVSPSVSYKQSRSPPTKSRKHQQTLCNHLVFFPPPFGALLIRAPRCASAWASVVTNYRPR